jgi:hypothetical protein
MISYSFYPSDGCWDSINLLVVLQPDDTFILAMTSRHDPHTYFCVIPERFGHMNFLL